LSLHPANVVQVGDRSWPDPSWGRHGGYAVFKPKGKLKVDEKASDGKSDAKVTCKGKEPPSADLELHWVDDTDVEGEPGPIETQATELIQFWSPLGENYGEAFEFVHPDAAAFGFDKIMFKEIEITREPGQGKCVFKIGKWGPPDKKDKDDTKTTGAADKWDVDANGKKVTNPTDKAGKGGFGGDNKPAVKP